MNRLLRQIRHLKAYAAPLIAERNRRDKYWLEKVKAPQAEEHLVRVILVFRYGKPHIDEPLALAHKRALSKLGVDEASSIEHLRRILEQESPDGDMKSGFSTWVGKMPDWLRHLCFVNISMTVLGLEFPLYSHDLCRRLTPTQSDEHAWPLLPQGKLEPDPYYRSISVHEKTPHEKRRQHRQPPKRRVPG